MPAGVLANVPRPQHSMGVIGPQTARATVAGGDGYEGTRRGVGLPILVMTPTCDGVIGAQTARVAAACGDGL